MAPRQYVTVTDYPRRKQNTIYEMRVASLRVIDKKTKEMSAKLEDLDKNQEGRIYEISRTPPPHPGNQTSLLLAACGANGNEIGANICLNELIGRHIGVKFNKSGEPLEFIQLEEKHNPAVNVTEPEDEDHISESF
ncbi:MAG: hypothetical protein ACYSWQ_04300 [Planctomycetota bacterium]|jgi:hypothetical protein